MRPRCTGPSWPGLRVRRPRHVRGYKTVLDQTRPPPGCTDPDRWLDAYLIAEAHRAVRGVCACGRPLPCIAAQRADEIMADTMRAALEAEAAATQAAREAEAAAEAQRAFSRAITQELPVIRVDTPADDAGPVGARFPRPRRRDREPDAGASGPSATGSWPIVARPDGELPPVGPPPSAGAPAPPTGWAFPPPADDPTPIGARFPRERRSSRHRA